ncbi:MAG: ribosome silencing factor [Pseudomonadota bacterium]|uniref:ribosome silencing factor n=1 Tax=Sulfuricystis thermophila TaxID=2496847 RepID=UPI0010363370|nr:ribosome silencing factor [Sulfuricystis thermophila]
MDIRKLQRIVVTALEDVKGKDIQVINTRKLSDLFGRIVIATGDSTRQVRALAKSVEEKVRAAGGEILGVEGEEAGEWVLVDCGDLVCHVMLPKTRAYYDLESLWQTRPKRAAPASPQT